QMLNSQPYTFLDGAPLEERRARAVALRRTLAPEDAVALGALDDAAIAQVVEEARPPMRDPDELHDALLSFMALREAEVDPAIAEVLVQASRAGWRALPQGRCLIPVERCAWLVRLFGQLQVSPPLPPWEVGVLEEPAPVA